MPRLIFAALCAFLLACTAPPPPAVHALPPAPAPVEKVVPAVPERTYEVRSGLVQRDETIVAALGRVGVDLQQAGLLVEALSGVFDFRKARPGDEFRVTTTSGQVDLFDYRRGPVEEYVVRRDGERLLGSSRTFDIEKKVVQISATLDSSLYEAVQAAKEDPQLALAFADVLAWDVDFYNDPRKGDSFVMVVEKYVHDGKLVRYGDILAAGYDGQAVGHKRVYRYADPASGDVSYYAEDGSAARRAFLKSPLKFAHVTSRFGLRFHPVLQYLKAHQGVDFAAVPGTPVWAVSDGTVEQAGWGGPCGNEVELRHANGLETIYCHLSRIAPGVRRGSHVTQKAVIAWSGATGRVTGPHLHYAVKRGGHFVNPLALKFPPSAPIPKAGMPAFQAAISPLLQRLSAVNVASGAAVPAPE